MASVIVKFEGSWVQLASRGLDREGLKRLTRRLGLSFHVDETQDDDTPRCPECRGLVLQNKWSGSFKYLCLDCDRGIYADGQTAKFAVMTEEEWSGR